MLRTLPVNQPFPLRIYHYACQFIRMQSIQGESLS
jgi:hypothetical protein